MARASEIGGQPDALQQGGDAARPLGAGGDAMDAQGIVEHARHGGARVEGGQRILEHHLQARAPGAQGSAGKRQEVVAFEFDGPASGSISRSTSRAIVDLPLPEGPASASVSPGSMWKETSSTAAMVLPPRR